MWAWIRLVSDASGSVSTPALVSAFAVAFTAIVGYLTVKEKRDSSKREAQRAETVTMLTVGQDSMVKALARSDEENKVLRERIAVQEAKEKDHIELQTKHSEELFRLKIEQAGCKEECTKLRQELAELKGLK